MTLALIIQIGQIIFRVEQFIFLMEQFLPKSHDSTYEF